MPLQTTAPAPRHARQPDRARPLLGQILLRNRAIPADALDWALARQRRSLAHLGTILLRHGLVSEAALYRALGAPCIPVALNSGLFWPRRGFVRRPGTIVLEYLPPIPPGLRRREFMALLEERIETASTALIAPTEPGTRAA